MIFLFLLPFYLAVSAYMLARFFYWLKHCNHRFDWKLFKIPFTVLFLVADLSPLIAFMLPKSQFAIIIRRVSTYWMGIMLYTLMFVAVFDLLRIIAKHTKLKNTRLFSRTSVISMGSILTACAVAVCLYGGIHARDIRTTDYTTTVNKAFEGEKDMKIVLVADLHMGYSIGVRQITNMVEKINAENPDLVVIAGDIFDNSYESLDDPDGIKKQLQAIKSKYGVYATLGNHDIEEKILMGFTFSWGSSPNADKDMIDYISECNVKLLRDESLLVDNKFYVVGRRDTEKTGTTDGKRASIESLTDGLDKSKPIIVISHEPDELQETADAGADLDLCGHTHNGQLFPGTLTIGMFWENPYGMIKKDNMTNVVTSGVGVYGPFMRVGTDAEICSIDVSFTK